MIRVNAAAWHEVLTRPGAVRQRPSPGTWSALEYGCHVRDVLRLYDRRLRLMLAELRDPADITRSRRPGSEIAGRQAAAIARIQANLHKGAR
jgi:hypothetical protein